MIDMSSIAAAIGSVKQILDIVEVARTTKETSAIAHVEIKLFQTLAKLSRELAIAQSEQHACADALREIKTKVSQMEAWTRQAERYTLKKVGTNSYCYALKPKANPKEPPHYLCQHCYENQQKSILQFTHLESHHRVLTCHRCKAEVRLPRTDGGNHILIDTRPSLNFQGY